MRRLLLTLLMFREHAAKIDFGAVMNDAYVRIYAKYFTTAELEELVRFYTSPIGRKSLEVMPDMMREGMQAGSEHLGPKISEAMAAAQADFDKKRPWRTTMSDLRSVATAVETYSIDHDDKYPAGDYASLEAQLVPTYLKKLPAKDMWNHDYAYVVSEDGEHYRLVSAGADANFEWDSRRIVEFNENEPAPTNYRDRLEDDLIYQDGSFLQLPVQAKRAQ